MRGVTRRVEFHPLARDDLLNLYNYIAISSDPSRADSFITRIERLCESLAEFPERAVPRPDLMPGLRSIALGRRAVIVLTIDADTVTILRVVYAGRDLNAQDLPDR